MNDADPYVIPVWEWRDPPVVRDEERRVLASLHIRTDRRWGEEYGSLDGFWVPLDAPQCVRCGEHWPCATSRLLSLVALVEHNLTEAVSEREAAQEALAEMGTTGESDYDGKRRVLWIRYEIDSIALMAGGQRVIDMGLQRVRDEMLAKRKELAAAPILESAVDDLEAGRGGRA
jgi:hypothetical protein